MKFDNLNRVVLTDETTAKLLEWRDKNQDLVWDYVMPIREGVIQFAEDFLTNFEVVGESKLKLTVFLKSENVLSFNYDTVNWKASNILFLPDSIMDGGDVNKAIQDIVSIHSSSMAYIVKYKYKPYALQTENISKSIIRIPKNSNSRSRRSGTSVIMVNYMVYTPVFPSPISERPKKRYLRHATEWSVRGHWRNLVSGKRVWVSAYDKGEGAKIEKDDDKVLT